MLGSPLFRIVAGLGLTGTVVTTVVTTIPKTISYEDYDKQVDEQCGADPRSLASATEEDKSKYKWIYDKPEDWRKCHDSILAKTKYGYQLQQRREVTDSV